jgi:hypothetical protein
MNPKDTERLQFQAQRNNTTLQEEIVLAMIKNPFMLYIPPFTANILKFSITRCMNLPPESKEIKKKVRKIMHCYDAYTKLTRCRGAPWRTIPLNFNQFNANKCIKYKYIKIEAQIMEFAPFEILHNVIKTRNNSFEPPHHYK